MEELIFLGVLVALVVGAVWMALAIKNKSSGRKPNHPVYRHSSTKRSRHKLAAKMLVHSHSADRIDASEEIWRASRIKANETRWHPGVIAANRILMDSELELEEREPEPRHGSTNFNYAPRTLSARVAGEKRKSG